jgi:membrane-associated phospholipid phosphatase
VPFVLFLVGGWCIEPGHICSAVQAIDRTGIMFSNKQFSPTNLAVLIFVTSLANPSSIVLLCCIALIAFLAFREKLVAGLFLVGLLLGDALVLTGKDFYDRPRPTEVWYSFTRLGASYPSGHAFFAVVFYGFIAYVFWHHAQNVGERRMISTIAILLIIAIGLSRVALDFHWLSDVLGGWLLGISILTLLIAGYRYIHYHMKKIVLSDRI